MSHLNTNVIRPAEHQELFFLFSTHGYRYMIKAVIFILIMPSKGAKVYPASRRRSNKRVGLKGQLVMIKKLYHAYKRLNTSSLGLGKPKSKTQL